MNTAYLFAAILAGGYLGSRLIFTRFKLARETEHMFLLGGEYILIGYLLGPSVLNILSGENIRQLSPIIVVGIGWLGLLLGNQLCWRNLRRFPAHMYQLLILENLLFILITGCLIWLLFKFTDLFFFNLGSSGFWVLLGAMTATSPTTLSLMAHHLKIPMRFTLVLRFLSSMDGLLGVVFLGIFYGLVHDPVLAFGLNLSGIFWFGLALLLGVLGGLFFHLIIRESSNDFETVLIIIGLVIYTGGLAYFLNISALFVAFVIGIVMANLSPAQAKVHHILSTTEKPFYIVFLVFAGALWNFSYWYLFLIAPLIFVIRILAKLFSTWGSTKVIPYYRKELWSLGLGLSSLAGLALAIAIEFYLLKPGETAEIFLGLVIFMVLINQLAAPFILRYLLPGLRSK